MAEAGWGHGRPVEMDTGIIPVLHAFVTQGGQLLGARRWPDNPLTLTHVRWQGPSSGPLEAVRRPSSEDTLADGEREVWVQLALAFPPAYSGPTGDAAWSPLAVDRDRAFAWLQKLRQEQRPRQSPSWSSSYGGGSMPGPRPAGPAGYAAQHGADYGVPPRPAPPYAANAPVGRSMPSPLGDRPSVPSGPMTFMSGTPTVVEPAISAVHTTPHPAPRQTIPPFGSPSRSTPSHVFDEPSQQTGSWQRGAMDTPEVVVVACVEVELPPMVGIPATDDYRRDFARDVALHFSRAARSVPQTREVRGWMRGDRLVLAARCVVGMGHRPPTQAEMNGVAHLLAEALAQRTLPYAQLGFADPGEWLHGAPLPE